MEWCGVKRKIVAVLLMFVMCLSVLSGCSLFELDEKSYYNSIVCTITFEDDEVVNIDKRELLLAWSSYGYNYEQNYGYSKEQAVKETLDSIIDQKVTRKAVENYYKENEEDVLNDNEKTYLWDYTYESLYGNLESYFAEIVDVPSGEDDSETKSKIFTENKPEIELTTVKVLDKEGNETQKLALKKTSSPSTIRETYEARYEEIDGKDEVYDIEFKNAEGEKPFKDKLYEKIMSMTKGESKSAKNWRGAFSKYISAIKSNYKYLNYKTEKEWFMFEIDRVYDILKGNYLVEQYTKIFNVQEQNGSTISGVSVDNILRRYSAKVQQDYQTYHNNKDAFETAIIDGLSNMEYIWQGEDATNFFQVAYIKLEFDATQKADYATYTEDNAYLEDPELKKALIDSLYNTVTVTVKDEYGDPVKVKNSKGEEVDKTVDSATLLSLINATAVGKMEYESKITANDVSEEIKAKLDSEKGDGKTTEQAIAEYVTKFNEDVDKINKNIAERKADAFRPFLYQYNDDTTQRNTETNLVFGVKANGEVLGKSDLTGIEGVNEEIKKLYEKNEIGAISDFVRANDGLYLFFYCGEVKNPFEITDNGFDIASREDNIYVLAHTYLNIFSRKTLLESLYNEVTTDKFTVFQNLNVAYLRSHLARKIEAFDNNLKDLY